MYEEQHLCKWWEFCPGQRTTAALQSSGQNIFFASFEIIGIMQTKWGKQDLFSSCFPRSAQIYCENEAWKFPPLHMHFNVEMLLWSTACLWCIINIFPLFGSSAQRSSLQTNGRKKHRASPWRSSHVFIRHFVHSENYEFTVDYRPQLKRHLALERVRRQWRGVAGGSQPGLDFADWTGSGLRLYSQIQVRLQAASPLGSRASVANQCHDLREMSLSSH